MHPKQTIPRLVQEQHFSHDQAVEYLDKATREEHSLRQQLDTLNSHVDLHAVYTEQYQVAEKFLRKGQQRIAETAAMSEPEQRQAQTQIIQTLV